MTGVFDGGPGDGRKCLETSQIWETADRTIEQNKINPFTFIFYLINVDVNDVDYLADLIVDLEMRKLNSSEHSQSWETTRVCSRNR